MGHNLKLSKDKRHRSSSSLAYMNVIGSRSERKISVTASASIPEVDEFVLAKTRCNELQEKIDMVKSLKKKKKRRSLTRVSEVTSELEKMPLIRVHTQPKKKNHRSKMKHVGSQQNLTLSNASDFESVQHVDQMDIFVGESAQQNKKQKRRYHMNPSIQQDNGDKLYNDQPGNNVCHKPNKSQFDCKERKPTTKYITSANDRSIKTLIEPKQNNNHDEIEDGSSYGEMREAIRKRFRLRRYELPTISSGLKKNVKCLEYVATHNRLPFISSHSTSPSHNIAVNIQQVLSGAKNKQPVSGIPLTIAHHMGLRRIVKINGEVSEPSLSIRPLNAIKIGDNYIPIPKMTLHNILILYKEGDGNLISRYLHKKIGSRFELSMHNLRNKVDDVDYSLSLSEYANIYKEYNELNERLRIGIQDPKVIKRREELYKTLAVLADRLNIN